MFDLSIDAQTDNWRLFNTRANDVRFKEYADYIFSRDEHKCQFCGFQSKVNMDIVNLNNDYGDNKTSNLVTACPLCSQCKFIDMVGYTENTGGMIIYLPEISQAQLNGLCHALFASSNLGTEEHKITKDIMNNLKLRAKLVEKKFAKGVNKPSLLGQLMIDTPMQNKESFYELIRKNLRLLPDADAFKKCLYKWSVDSNTLQESAS